MTASCLQYIFCTVTPSYQFFFLQNIYVLSLIKSWLIDVKIKAVNKIKNHELHKTVPSFSIIAPPPPPASFQKLYPFIKQFQGQQIHLIKIEIHLSLIGFMLLNFWIFVYEHPTASHRRLHCIHLEYGTHKHILFASATRKKRVLND